MFPILGIDAALDGMAGETGRVPENVL